MTTNNWTDSTANWNTPSDWSAGLPDSSSDVVINRYGNPDVTASFGTVATIDINNRASLTFTDAGASTVAGGATVKYGGALYLDASGGDGGSALTIGGRLTNSGTIEIGPSDNTLSAASTIEAAHLSSTGTLDLYGSSTVQAVLDVTSGAGFGTAETLTGQVNLSDDALIEFKGGQITTIAASGALRLIGSQAFVADASNTSSNSALKGLETVTGVLELEKGATVKTSGDLANGGSIALDSYSGGGGSLLNIKGTLTNSGTVSIGNSTLSANSSLTAASVVNSGTISLYDAGGSSVAGGVTNSSRLLFDVSSGNGGSSLTIGGTLTNDGFMEIGPDDATLSAASTVRAASLTNDGTIDIYGSSIARATLDVAAPAGFGAVGVLDGQINLAGQALAEFGSGQITTIAARSELSLTGPRAFVADASDTSSNSALSGLVRIDPRAVLLLADGASVTTSGALLNLAKIELDPSSWEGKSSLAVGGVLRNGGTIQIGPADGTLSAASVVTAVKIANFRSTTSGTTYGAIDITGNDSANLAQPIAATLDIAGAAGFGVSGVLEGSVNLAHDGNVVFRGGQITTIAANSELTLTGRDSVVADASTPGSNSALRRLDTVTGDLNLSYGATVTTSGDLTSSGAINLDSAYGDGGSFLKINGTLTNDGTIEIGPSSGALSARSMMKTDSVINDGTINLYGDGPTGSTHATLTVPGAFTNDGAVNLTDDYDKLAGPVSGTGNFSLSDGSRLQFSDSVSIGETVAFGAGAPEQLILDHASLFAGTIDDFFATGDMAIAKDFAEAATTLLYTQTGADSCSWTLTDGANTAVLNFAGEPYMKSDFSVVPANGGTGLAIKFV